MPRPIIGIARPPELRDSRGMASSAIAGLECLREVRFTCMLCYLCAEGSDLYTLWEDLMVRFIEGLGNMILKKINIKFVNLDIINLLFNYIELVK